MMNRRVFAIALAFGLALLVASPFLTLSRGADFNSPYARYLYFSASDPAYQRAGQIYYNTTANTAKLHNGTTWKTLAFTDSVIACSGCTTGNVPYFDGTNLVNSPLSRTGASAVTMTGTLTVASGDLLLGGNRLGFTQGYLKPDSTNVMAFRTNDDANYGRLRLGMLYMSRSDGSLALDIGLSGADVLALNSGSTIAVSSTANANAGKDLGLARLEAGAWKVTNGSTGGGTIKIGDPGTKPTCDSTRRGMLWIDEGAGGVKDSVEVCAKDAGDAYAWRTLY